MRFYEYAKHVNATQSVLDWVEKRMTDDIDTTEGEHVIDFLVSDVAPKRLERATYEQMKKKAQEWVEQMNAKGVHIQEEESDTETILDFQDGFRVVKLIGENAFKREGFLMRHCVASYFGKDVEVYSLRDANNVPHCTIEKDKQIKGKGNGDIHPKYIDYVVQFLKKIDMTVGNSEMLHLGYINVEKFKDDLGGKILTKLYDDKYLPKSEKLIDKNGNEFASLDLWEQIPVVSEDHKGELKINFELKSFIKLSFEYLFSKIKKQAGDNSRQAQAGDSSRQAQAGHYSQQAQAGDSSRQAQAGHYSQQAQAGGGSQQAQAGHYSQQAQAGGGSQQEMNGLFSVSVNAGDKGKIKGKIGCWFALTEWYYDTDKIWKPLCVKAAQIDGKKIKEDTWYTLKNGKIVETTPNK